MKEVLDRVIQKIILPKYPNIVSYTIIYDDTLIAYIGSPKSLVPHIAKIHKYTVLYYFQGNEKVVNFDKIRGETESIFEMLGPEKNEQMNVLFGEKIILKKLLKKY